MTKKYRMNDASEDSEPGHVTVVPHVRLIKIEQTTRSENYDDCCAQPDMVIHR